MHQADPVVSIIIANYNGAHYLADALASAVKQTLRSIEILVVDDLSTDGSLDIARDFARLDSRIRVLSCARRSGPGGARNHGLQAARGQWIAILDNDDFMHPLRLEQMVQHAIKHGADICADDMLVFQEGAPPAGFLSPRQRKLGALTAAQFIAGNQLFSRAPVLGYLKPLIKTSFLRAHAVSYNADLPIGEDYDLIVQLLAKGARFCLLDQLGYFYRKHSQSISHRMSGQNVAQMLAADEELRKLFPDTAEDVVHAFELRRKSIERAAAFSALVAALKNKQWVTAGRLSLRHPGALPLLHMPLRARLRRLWPKRAQSASQGDQPRICLISRQRLIGNTNGSSAYVIALAGALREAGYQLTLISPSMATFGRWPVLRLRPEMRVFDQIHVRGAWSWGSDLHIARDPRIALSAAGAVLARLAGRLGLRLSFLDKPAPYAIATPWHREDQLYIARHVPAHCRLLLADYAFTTPAIPYALAPRAASAVIMHDFFSGRAERFREQKLADSVTALDQITEMKLLGQADAVIAIQKLEAAEVARHLPRHTVMVVPPACRVVAAPQPGDSRSLLFVGSNTAPNIIGLEWFLNAIWPTIRRARGDCQLLVAGSVSGVSAQDAVGVRFLGMVPDLAPLYRDAGVVISPLTVGSGLKIKLIEALGHGKAIVATRVTTEGCDEAVIQSIFERDEAEAFAQAVIQLLADETLRQKKAAEALEVARRFYAPESCYRSFLEFVANAHEVPGFPESVAPAVERRRDVGATQGVGP